ncbi:MULTISPECIES: DUF4352 domain-containing protein [unclassified Cellulomonas]|uniref:DUF4352 domain-containing protein n=1 Tax=unclassified Cellulomonas TaxID=2620175 RepID=UPI0024B6B6AF|nr:DUF4352 domain-containing protein [Cellulomonas sp. ES6]WHP18952.1 DUF4352 domain-containing protein [Cellulomonas sp. ES6]
MSQVPPPGSYPVPGAPTPPPSEPPTRKRSWFARHKVLTTLGVLVVAVVAIASATSGGSDAPDASAPAAGGSTAGGGGDPAAPADDPAADDAGDDAAPAAEQPAGIGTPVRDGKFEFTVTGVEPGVARIGDDMLGQDAQGQFVLVHLTVTNIGEEAQYFDGSSQKAFDAQGRELSADGTAAVYLGDANSFLNQINPGNSVTGTVVFDIPADAALTRLELHDSPFSGGVEVALG